MGNSSWRGAKKPVLFLIAALLMVLTALPMIFWSLSLINSAALDRTFIYAGLGCFLAAPVYGFSMITAISGLVLYEKPHQLRWRRVLALIQLVEALLLVAILLPYGVMVLPPLLVLTPLYLMGLGGLKK